MKSFVIFCTFSLFAIQAFSQGVWQQKADFGGGNREHAFWFSINNMGYVGGGRNNNIALDDLWQYNPVNNTWSQKANFPGGPRFLTGTFVLGDTAFIIGGWDTNFQPYNDCWAYIPGSNIWIQKNNFPGIARYASIGFSINDKGYFGTGFSPFLNDLWEYTPPTDSWIQKPNVPGMAREHATGITVNTKGYVGMGFNNGLSLNDWWEYDPTSNSWTQKASFPGGARRGTAYFELNGKAYVGTGYDDVTYFNDFWEYNPITNQWCQRKSIPSAGRYGGIAFALNGHGYLGTGSNNGVASPHCLNDFWEYLPVTLTYNYSTAPCSDTVIFNFQTQSAVNQLWQFGDGTSDTSHNPTHIYSAPGNYNVVLTAYYLCGNDSVSFLVNIQSNSNPDFTYSIDSCTREVTFINKSSSALNYFWNFGDGNSATVSNPIHVYNSPGSYMVTLIVDPATICEDSIRKTILINSESNLNGMFVPNCFTPNDDGINDNWCINNGGCQEFSVNVFNRWGQIVFKQDPFICWDGKCSGKKLPEGVYVYILKINKGYAEHGIITLIR